MDADNSTIRGMISAYLVVRGAVNDRVSSSVGHEVSAAIRPVRAVSDPAELLAYRAAFHEFCAIQYSFTTGVRMRRMVMP